MRETLLVPISRIEAERLINYAGEVPRFKEEVERIINLPSDRRTEEQKIEDTFRGITIQYACKIVWNIEHHDNIYQDLQGQVSLDGVTLQDTTEIKTIQRRKDLQKVFSSMSWNNFENKGIDAPSNLVIWFYKDGIYYPFQILTRKIKETDEFTLVKEYKWPNLNMR